MKALVVLDSFEGEIRAGSLEAIGAASGVADELIALVPCTAETRDQLVGQAERQGVGQVIALVSDAPLTPDTLGAELASVVSELSPDLVIGSHSVDAMGYAPALAVRSDSGFASDVTGLSSSTDGLVVSRTLYGGKVQADLAVPTPAVVTVRSGVWEAAAEGGSPEVNDRQASAPVRVSHREYLPAPTGDVDISQAEFILAIGRGVGEAENLDQFRELAEKFGATLAASRPIVDAGWEPAARQVGQSGKTVAPKVYLALGISGAIQHLAGMRGSKTIIAVNTDPEAAIFKVAQYGAVTDMFDLADELEALL